MPGVLQRLRERLAPRPPGAEEAVDRAVRGMRRRLTEARLQVAAARGAERREGRAIPSTDLLQLERGLSDLEGRVAGAVARRDALVASLQRARAASVVQRTLSEVQRMDVGLAFDALEAAVRDAEATGDATRAVQSGPERQR